MNSHDVGRGRGGVEAALRRITAELTVGVVSSDRLFTAADGRALAASPACRELAVVDSPYGHDAFLIETEQVFGIISRALTGAPVAQVVEQAPAGTDASSGNVLVGPSLW
jgi:homoserine O-acetyltransferase